jgi:alanine racemase
MKFFPKGTYRTLNTVRISEEALRHNLSLYRDLFPGKAICPVLKSNAYGHGLLEVAKVLDKEKPTFMIVDSLYEAYELEKAGIKSDILVLGYTFPGNLTRKRLPFHFAVSDFESAKVLAKQGAKVHLKVDTGMNRMGFDVENLRDVLPELKEMNLKVEGVLTHLADPDNPSDDSYTTMQLELFEEAVRMVKEVGFDPQWIHPGQSAGALKSKEAGNMVRLGLALYGVAPLEESDSSIEMVRNLRPVMELYSTVVGVKHLKPGDRVSYNGIFETDRLMTIAMVPVGYYEALPRVLSGKGFMEVKGVLCPMVGRMCMNYTMIDVSEVPEVGIGDSVCVYSSDKEASNSILALAKSADLIPYEMMTRVAASVRREIN